MKKQSGFAHMSMLLMVGAVLIVGAIGYIVWDRSNNKQTANTNNTAQQSIEPDGTVETLSSEVEQNLADEEKTISDGDSSEQEVVNSTNSNAAQIGDSVDETN